jgi:hypothetical protein
MNLPAQVLQFWVTFFIAILGRNSQIFGILLPRLDTTLPRANFFAHKLTCASVAILGHFFIQPMTG